jgi:hypothetical protein
VKEGVTNLVQHRLITSNGVNRVMCGIECSDRWLVAHGGEGCGADYNDDPVRIQNSCAACAWCGETVAVPVADCRIHPDFTCPDSDVLYTLHAARAVILLRRLNQGRELPAAAFILLEKAAETFRLVGTPVTADLLAERVWDVRTDWQP